MDNNKKRKQGQYAWFTDGKTERYLFLEEQDVLLTEGWYRGRCATLRKVNDRQFAKARGDMTYKGKKCALGHTTKYVSTGQCVACLKLSYEA